MSSSLALSILIPTLIERRECRTPLLSELENQMVGMPVELLLDEDNRERTTGAKRNALLARAQGKFSVFIDDDDWISDTYIKDVVNVIQSVEVDCIGIWGETHWGEEWTRTMIHSLMCPAWTEWKGKDGRYVYYRHPNHLNPIRTDISRSIPYRDITISEDHFWTLAMADSGKLKREVFLAGKCMYHYLPHGAVRTL